jgi:hypothetical protein
MSPTHLATLVRARTCLAVLADDASSTDAASSYERVLIHLDRLHHDESPALLAPSRTTNRATLFITAHSAVASLADHGVDPLELELLLAALDDAWALGGA